MIKMLKKDTQANFLEMSGGVHPARETDGRTDVRNYRILSDARKPVKMTKDRDLHGSLCNDAEGWLFWGSFTHPCLDHRHNHV